MCMCMSPPSPPLPSIVEALYTHLLDAYLNHFLPFTGTVPPPLTSSPTQESPHYLATPPGFNQSDSFTGVSMGSPRTLGLLKTNLAASTPVSRYSLQPGMEGAQAETFVQVSLYHHSLLPRPHLPRGKGSGDY